MQLGHGTFFYLPDETAAAYGSVDAAVATLDDYGMRHAWVRAHSGRGLMDEAPTRELIEKLRARDIEVAIWGWCDGDDLEKDLDHVRRSFETFGVRNYVADIEHDVRGAHWNEERVRTFLGRVRDLQDGGDLLAMSTFGFICDHEPELVAAAEPFVDCFAPQCYWHWYPADYMLTRPGAVEGAYGTDNAADYVSLCIDLWRHLTDHPLIITGQTYWGEKEGWEEPQAYRKLLQFSEEFDRWGEIAGLNWWHHGGGKTMSERMREVIREAHFDRRLEEGAADEEQPGAPIDLVDAVATEGPEPEAYDIEQEKKQRSYFDREPKSNVDKCRTPPSPSFAALKAKATAEFDADTAEKLAGPDTANVDARYFVIHDTAGTTEPGTGPNELNPHDKASTRGIHLWIGARKLYRQHDWGTAGYGTKMESRAANRHFLHVEMTRDRHLANDPTFYNEGQYRKLAYGYLFASLRRGRFLTVTSHNEVDRACCYFNDTTGKFTSYGHNDPVKFDLGELYRTIAELVGLPADATFGIEPKRVNGKNFGGQVNVMIQYVKGLTDEANQYGNVPWATGSNDDRNLHKKVKHSSFGMYYDLPIYRIVNGTRYLPRDVP